MSKCVSSSFCVLGLVGGAASGKTVRLKRILQRFLPLFPSQSITTASDDAPPTPHELITPLPRDASYVHAIMADQYGHAAYTPGTPLYHKLIQQFGERIVAHPSTTVDGAGGIAKQQVTPMVADGVEVDSKPLPMINRAVLREIVFSDKAQLSTLNSLVWPVIKDLILVDIQRCRDAAKEKKVETASETTTTSSSQVVPRPTLVVLEAALLMEIGLHTICDAIWFIDLKRDVAIERAVQRDGLTVEVATSRIDSQMTLEDRLKQLGEYNAVIERDGGRAPIRSAVIGTDRPFDEAMRDFDQLTDDLIQSITTNTTLPQ